MRYAIFQVDQEHVGKINTLLKDDVVSRQSIVTRDANALDIKGNESFVKIEGSEEGVKRAETLAQELGFKKLAAKKANEINEKIKHQEDSAATGMGMIFD